LRCQPIIVAGLRTRRANLQANKRYQISNESRVRQPPWADLALLIERQLLAKKQILGTKRSSRTQTRASKIQRIDRQVGRNAEYKEKQSEEIYQSIIRPVYARSHRA
jgi:hypothetical protein